VRRQARFEIGKLVVSLRVLRPILGRNECGQVFAYVYLRSDCVTIDRKKGEPFTERGQKSPSAFARG
jgi:hypothetical protein